jgi:hypothetical protein
LWRKSDEERELMLIEAAWHIKKARSQRALYQGKVARAVQDATAKKDHSEKVYLHCRLWTEYGAAQL